MDVGIKELRNNLSRYVALVREGEDVWITERGTRVARIVRVDETDYDRMVRDGLLIPPRTPKRPLTEDDYVRTASGAGICDIVIEQRR